MQQITATAQIRKGKEAAILRRHPWVFSGAIQKWTENKPQDGDLVEIHSYKGDFLGLGHFQDATIAIRIISFDQQDINQEFWNEKIASALNLRKQLGLFPSSQTKAFRLFHAEGDTIPGLIIDFYHGHAVVQAHSIGVHRNLSFITKALEINLGNDLLSVYDKSAETLPNKGNYSAENKQVWGDVPYDFVEILEHGHTFKIDWVNGQKTGFFIDQRENRYLLAQYAKDKKVLNTFCYSGGFSVYALAAGAKEVHSVDVSAKAIALTEENVSYLTLQENQHHAIQADVMKYLKDIDEDFDVIILDPPAFAKHQSAKHNAVQGYKRLNALALKKIKSGGILFTFSCSQAIDKSLFSHTIAAAAIETGRKVSILHYLSQPADHPINIYHPESEYLKGLVLHVE